MGARRMKARAAAGEHWAWTRLTRRLRLARSLRFKAGMCLALLVVASLYILNTYPASIMRRQIIHAKESEMLAAAGALASALEGFSELSAESAHTTVTVLNVLGDRRALICDSTGVILFDSLKTSNLLGSVALFPELIAALSGEDAFRCTYDSLSFTSRVAVPVMLDGMVGGAVFLYDVDMENAAVLQQIKSNLRAISVVIAFVSLALLTSFVIRLSSRMNVLLSGVREMGAGNYNAHVDMSGEDEIAEVAREFNLMSEKIRQDEDARRQFVSDASHELKTPLASIKLLSDSIIQTENIRPEEVKEFLQDISDEIDRLTRITESLLALNRLDAAPRTELMRCDLGDTARKCTELLRGRAAVQRVELINQVPQGCEVRASRDGLHQALFNLMENAVKYNREGGSVTVSVQAHRNKVELWVRDTGIGIPEDDLPRVFERFYRVDKTRARATGGNGLGLAIAAEWAGRMGGELRVKSRVGHGSVFILALEPWKGEWHEA